MKPTFENRIGQLHTAHADWQAHAAQEAIAGSYAVNSIQVELEDVGRALNSSIRFLEFANSNEHTDAATLAYQQGSIAAACDSITNFIAAARSNNSRSWLESNLTTLLGHIFELRRAVLPLVPLDRAAEAVDSTRLIEITTKAQAIGSIEEHAYSQAKKIDAFARETAAKVDEFNRAEETARSKLTSIQQSEQAATAARAAAETSSAAATAEQKKVDESVKTLSGAQAEKEALFKAFEDYKSQVEALLEGASKVGLAKSFAARRDYLQKTQWLWAGAFAVGIVLLGTVGFSIFFGVSNVPPLIDKDGRIDVGQALARLFIAGPAVWFTWFAAKQFGHVLRITEDYAFKEAAALAFIGYRNEMGTDADMLKLLRESAIRSYGANPARLLGRNAAASPLHDAIDQALDKGLVEKAIEMLKVLKPGGRS